ncbi:MAG: radical SAM protein [Acidobacteria bacterium]|nr:radical SAM protein [Acidobacteriota bacterium]
MNCVPEAERQQYAEIVHFFDWGVNMRSELIPIARKVHKDFAALADSAPEGPALMKLIESILQEADRWGYRGAGIEPKKGDHPIELPEAAQVTRDQMRIWAASIDTLYFALGRLGTYCHFHLKEQRKRDRAAEAPTAPPLMSPEAYQDLKRKNLLLNDLEILLGRSRLASYPLRMELDPTNECNLRCRGCRHGITKDFHHVELRRDYVEILSEAFPYIDYMYPIGTGEPTMSSTLPLLINEASRHGVKVDMLTNGTILEKAHLPWEKFYRLGISVDGATEETMRALRPVAPLAHVLQSLKDLRAKAPQARIYTKVTVSRMNYDELPALMEKLADSGVNEVIVHSLEVFHQVHEFIQVRAGDRDHMMECVESARRVAEGRGIHFVNALNFSGAARHDDRGLDKPTMFQMLKENPLPVLKIQELASIAESVRGIEFRYFPAELEGLPGFRPAPVAVEKPRPAAVRIDTIDKEIASLTKAVRGLRAGQVQVPYCFLPWKMSIVESDGRARPCCHLEGHLDDVDQANEFQDLWSGPGYGKLRDSMFHWEKMPNNCKRCEEFDRSAYSADTFALADMLEAPVRMAPRHPVPVDVTKLIHTSKVKRSGFEMLSCTQKGDTYTIPPGGQILARFANPKTPSGVYYQGQFQIRGGSVLVGVKPLWGGDIWNYMLDAKLAGWLGDWIGLPMPPLTLDFRAYSEEECCVFLWAPSDNAGDITIRVRDFTGVVTAPGPAYGDSLQLRHFWSGVTAQGM